MLLKYFYDTALAHASYLVACQKTQEAIVIDPGRDIDAYLLAAKREGLRLTAAAETHIHADYVSGARELAARCGATLYLSDAGPAPWKYRFAQQYASRLLRDGDQFHVGKIAFTVMHTPGHTPESITFILTDAGSGANKPMGIFTGDFVFVGAVGRPDLLEEAVGIGGAADTGARDLYRSVQQFKQLPDYLQVWPAHGAGSACGKGLGAIPSSTVGYEKLVNPALQHDNEAAFVRYILADQPEVPPYFARMKRVNQDGPAVLGDCALPLKLGITALPDVVRTHAVIDISPPGAFAQAHVPGVLNIPSGMLAAWAGWLLDLQQPLYLITSPAALPEAARVLRKIGADQLSGYFDREDVMRYGFATQTYAIRPPPDVQVAMARDALVLLDVRARAEWQAERIPGAQHVFLGTLPTKAQAFANRSVAVQCLSLGRSAVAASILQAAGIDVVQLAGGITAWKDSGLPVVSGP